jgi:CHAT domain-containing protein/predicted negative regulator of RcsB-dependent stress response
MRSEPRFVDDTKRTAVCLLLLWISACGGGAERAKLSETEGSGRTIRVLIDAGRYADAQSSAGELLRSVWHDVGQQPSEASALALDLVVEARWRNGDAALDTLSLAERAVDWRRRLGRKPPLAMSLRNLGLVRLLAGRPREAVTVLEAGLATLEPAVDHNDPALAEALDALAAGLVEMGRYEEAEDRLRRSVEIRQKASLEDGSGLAHTFELRSLVFLRTGRYSEARPPLERALAIRRAQPDHPETAATFSLLADLFWLEGRPAAARDAAAQCLSIVRKSLRSTHPDIARCTRQLGNMLASLGDMSGALASLEQAAVIAEQSLGVEHQLFSGYLNDLAEVHRALMDYNRARTLYERALAIRERRLGPDHQNLAGIVYNLGLVSSELGDLVEARRQFDRAAAIWSLRLGADHPFVALAMASLAQALLQHGRAEEALSLQRRVLAIRERSLGPNHRETADALGDLASTLLATGRISEAAAASARAITIWERTDALESPSFAAALTLRGNVLAAMGNLRDARERYARALAISERVLGSDHPNSADLRIRLAAVALQSGRSDMAFDLALVAERAARRFLQSTVRYLPEREALSYGSKRPSGLNLVLSIAGGARFGAANAARALDAVVRARALVLDEVAARKVAVQEETENELASLRTSWVSSRQKLANLAVRGTKERSASAYQAALDDARREAERVERALAETSASFKAERDEPEIGLAQVQAALPRGSALVSFVRYERAIAASSTNVASERSLSSYLAFVVGPTSSHPTVLALDDANIIDRDIAEWRSRITGREIRTESAAVEERMLRSLGNRLRRRIWDPVEPYVRGADRVFVVPDGALHLVNLSALPVGSSQYLIEQGPLIHYLTAERDIVLFARRTPSVARGLLALGGPMFEDDLSIAPSAHSPVPEGAYTGTRSTCASFQSMQFAPLPGTLKEARDVVQVWNEVGGQNSQSAYLLTGTNASERVFKMQAPGKRVLHLATHGFFLGTDCAANAESTRGVAGLVNAEGRNGATAIPESPLLQSGLALAGANRHARAKPDEEDGILTAEEVAALNLDGVEWAVLSACDTGLGEIKAGEGVMGLRRAFQTAGARTVIMSLWPVEDQATGQWMRTLYQGRFSRHLSTAESVRSAGLAVLRDRRAKGLSTQPFYWAAFVAAGDWR